MNSKIVPKPLMLIGYGESVRILGWSRAGLADQAEQAEIARVLLEGRQEE